MQNDQQLRWVAGFVDIVLVASALDNIHAETCVRKN